MSTILSWRAPRTEAPGGHSPSGSKSQTRRLSRHHAVNTFTCAIALMLLPTLPLRIDTCSAHRHTRCSTDPAPALPAHAPAAAWPSSLDHASVHTAAASGLCTSVLASRLPLPWGASPTLGSSGSIHHLHLPPRLPGQNSQVAPVAPDALPALPISAALIRTWQAALPPVFLSVSSARAQAS